MKTPSVHFIKKTIKTFTIKTTTKSMMISFINIILSDQKMNKCTINVSSQNLKPNLYVDSIYQFQCDFFFFFLSITLLNTRPKTGWYRIGSSLFARLCFGLKKKLFCNSVKLSVISLQILHFSHLSEQKVSPSLT